MINVIDMPKSLFVYESINLPFCITEKMIYIIVIMEGMLSKIRSMLQGI